MDNQKQRHSQSALEASLLRFALSEHFLNVDQLLSQLQASPSAPIKKKELSTIAQRDRGTKAQSNSVQMTDDEPRVTNHQPQITNSEHREPLVRRLVRRSASEVGSFSEGGSIENQEKPEPVASEQKQAQPTQNRLKTSSQRKNELINHPAVKTILMGLDATICGVEEDQ